jgi:hypothetical protein
MHEGAAVLGEAPVYKDGSWLAEIPPFIPVHLQPIDKWGMAIRNQMLWIQGMPGEDRRCVGCHESRTGAGVPRFGQNPTVAEQRPPEKYLQPIADRVELPWDKKIQPILTAKCASCHNAQTTQYYALSRVDPATGQATEYKIPTLDLTDTPVTVVYDRRVATYASSYVSIFYPAASAMTGPGAQVQGTLPPLWGVPGSARQSKLIEKINVKAEDGTLAWPDAPMHPEDKGPEHALTPQERQMLIQVMDLGGQYYSRQNTEFTPNPNDPVGGIKY